jgi:hypothetical protein
MSDKPDLSNRRTRAQIKPAPDEHVDAIEGAQVRATAKPKAAPRDLNLQVSDEVFETIDYAKFKTKLTKRAIVEQAVLAHWSDYRPEA